MKRTPKLYLLDILEATDKIEIFLAKIDTVQAFEQDEIALSAVMYQLFIVGEAVTGISNQELDFELSHLREIKSFRNLIAHAYFKIKPSQVWNIVKEDLPVFKAEVQALLTA